jgi:hypothetical protein
MPGTVTRDRPSSKDGKDPFGFFSVKDIRNKERSLDRDNLVDIIL